MNVHVVRGVDDERPEGSAYTQPVAALEAREQRRHAPAFLRLDREMQLGLTGRVRGGVVPGHDLAADVREHREELAGAKVERASVVLAEHERDGAGRLGNDARDRELPNLGRSRPLLSPLLIRRRRPATAGHERGQAMAGGAPAEDVHVATELLERDIPRARETFG